MFVERKNIRITRGDLLTLRGLEWLNDEVCWVQSVTDLTHSPPSFLSPSFLSLSLSFSLSHSLSPLVLSLSPLFPPPPSLSLSLSLPLSFSLSLSLFLSILQVINFYLSLVIDTVNDTIDRKVHLFNSFFYPKIMSNGYSGVRRWTKKVCLTNVVWCVMWCVMWHYWPPVWIIPLYFVHHHSTCIFVIIIIIEGIVPFKYILVTFQVDIFSYDIILLPVHLGMHWCLASIDFNRQKISYYDSLRGSNRKCLQVLRYLR